MMPRVLNKRTDKIPSDAVYVGRPSKWGNPFKVKKGVYDRRTVVKMYREYLDAFPELKEMAKLDLKGRDLVC